MDKTLQSIIDANMGRALKGDPDAVDAVLRSIELQARIKGLPV